MLDLKKKAITGAAWMVGMRMAVNVIGFLSTIVLARILDPTDFGIVALAGSAYAFFRVLGQFGFEAALIQFENPTPDHYSSAWTANILVGLAISSAMFLVAGPAAKFFEDPRIEFVVYAFSLLSLAKGFENVGVVNFRKNLQFRGDFLYFVIPKLTSAAAAITAALILKSYWALVIGMVTSQIVFLMYSHFSQPFRPKLSLSKVGELFGFSRWMLISNLLQYVSHNGIEIILGRLRSAADVGVFGIARQIAYLPSSEIMAPINRALFPSFSAISSDIKRMRQALVKVIAMTAIISIPVACGIAACANYIVVVILGDKWMAAAPVLSVLALVGVVEGVLGLFRPVLLARGRPKAITVVLVAYIAIVIPSVIYMVPRFGTVGVAYAMLLGSVITAPLLIGSGSAAVGLRFRQLLGSIWRPIIASGAMYYVISAITGNLVLELPIGVSYLIVLAAIGAATYTAVLLTLWAMSGMPSGAERQLLHLARDRIAAVHATKNVVDSGNED